MAKGGKNMAEYAYQKGTSGSNTNGLSSLILEKLTCWIAFMKKFRIFY